MKFHWFHGMPWPHLPTDFRAHNRSVWVDPDSRLYDPVEGGRLYHEYLDQLEFAERVGFDGLVLNEHHQHVFGLMPSPQLMAAALARQTSRAAIILLGMSIALYRPATRAAEEIAMLDVVSGGRIVAGFPLGTPMDTNFAYGTNPAELRKVYREHHDLILRAWSDPNVFAWNGETTKLRYVNIWPRPIQRPHPPIWIPADGISAETWDFCADRGYAYVCLASRGIAPAQAAMDGFWSRVEARGIERNPYQGVVSQTIIVADSDAEAQERYQQHLDFTSRHTLDDFPGWTEAPGWRSERGIREQAVRTMSQLAEPTQARVPTWQERIERGSLAAGSPSTVTEQLEHLVTTLGVGHLVGVFHIGDMSHEATLRSTRLFAEHVIPRLRHLWDDSQDHWSPRPISLSQPASQHRTNDEHKLAGVN